jgi:hypothetical protein
LVAASSIIWGTADTAGTVRLALAFEGRAGRCVSSRRERAGPNVARCTHLHNFNDLLLGLGKAAAQRNPNEERKAKKRD